MFCVEVILCFVKEKIRPIKFNFSHLRTSEHTCELRFRIVRLFLFKQQRGKKNVKH